jgi:hypothetical protein
VFEVSITKTMKQTKGDIPNIIKKTVKYIEERGTRQSTTTTFGRES